MRPDAIAVVGVSHWSAPLAERERFAFGTAVVRRLLRAGDGERLLLVTCNRTELYGVGPTDALRTELLEAAGLTDAPLDARSGERAVSHLFSVASGLDSMVLGEHQILGQVKRATKEAREEGALGPLLDELARRALRVGRRVRRETDLGRSLPSIPKVAVGVARLVLGELAGARILVVGSGKLGDLTARALRRTGAQELIVTNRRIERARALAEAVGGRAEPYQELDRLLAETDLVISCTAAPDPVLNRERIVRALDGRSRAARRLAFIDIAVPRDVDPAVRSLPGVRLFDLDDLREWSSVSVAPGTLEAARAIVEDETRDFQGWLAGRTAVPTIRELHERAEAILDAELGMIPESERETARRFGRRLMRKLLHPPVSRLKDGAASEGEAYVRLARDLFALDAERRDDRRNGGGGPA
ncbi:MAG TPA: glutamyl-tRNA reductase [Gemmatimonadota bacterium]|nr:glutamyl-tRNA reductase [Gemmatimonadota bacterium]